VSSPSYPILYTCVCICHTHTGEEEEEEEEEEAKEKEEMDEDTSVYEAENTRLYQRVADFRRRYRRYVRSLPSSLPLARGPTRPFSSVPPNKCPLYLTHSLSSLSSFLFTAIERGPPKGSVAMLRIRSLLKRPRSRPWPNSLLSYVHKWLLPLG